MYLTIFRTLAVHCKLLGFIDLQGLSKFSKSNLVRVDHSMIQKFKLPNLEKIAAFKRSLHLEIVALKQKFILASLPPYVLLIVII